MKIQVLASFLIVALLAGCASVSDPKLLGPLTSLTVVSVSANDKLYYLGDQPPQTSLLDQAMNSASNDGKNNAVVNKVLEKTDMYVNRGEELLTSALSAFKGSTLIPKDTLFASQAYMGAAEAKSMEGVSLRPAGYKFVRLEPALAANLSKELGANGLITAYFLFQKSMVMGIMGTGTLGAQTTLTITAFDSAGKLVFTKGYVGVSKTNTGVLANVYDPTKYEPVVNDATQVAIDKFAADLAAAR